MEKINQLKELIKIAEQLKYEGLTVAERFEGFKQVRDLTAQLETAQQFYNKEME